MKKPLYIGAILKQWLGRHTNTAQVDSFIDAGNPIRVSPSAPKPWTMRAKPTLI